MSAPHRPTKQRLTREEALRLPHSRRPSHGTDPHTTRSSQVLQSQPRQETGTGAPPPPSGRARSRLGRPPRTTSVPGSPTRGGQVPVDGDRRPRGPTHPPQRGLPAGAALWARVPGLAPPGRGEARVSPHSCWPIPGVNCGGGQTPTAPAAAAAAGTPVLSPVPPFPAPPGPIRRAPPPACGAGAVLTPPQVSGLPWGGTSRAEFSDRKSRGGA